MPCTTTAGGHLRCAMSCCCTSSSIWATCTVSYYVINAACRDYKVRNLCIKPSVKLDRPKGHLGRHAAYKIAHMTLLAVPCAGRLQCIMAVLPCTWSCYPRCWASLHTRLVFLGVEHTTFCHTLPMPAPAAYQRAL